MPTDSKETWTWFLRNLRRAFPSIADSDTVVTSDRDKGLLNAIDYVAPRAVSGYCCFHLKENVRKSYGEHMAELFWRSVSVGEIRSIDSDCADYIMSIGVSSWQPMRSH